MTRPAPLTQAEIARAVKVADATGKVAVMVKGAIIFAEPGQIALPSPETGRADMEHFNKLTPAEAERLAMLAEECGEVIQIVGKILRHGYDSYHPADPNTTNRDLLAKELRDVNAVLQAMSRFELKDYSVQDWIDVWERKLQYTHHQEETK